MRDMRESGVEWIGEIPSSWEIIANKHLMKKVKDIRNKYTGEDVLSLTMRGVIVRDLENPSGKMPATFDGYQFVEAGNLLMCLFDIDVTPRCIGLIKNDGVCSPAYSQFQMSDKADAGFYYYYYLNLDHTKELLHLAKNLRHSLTEEQLGAVPTALPPIEEQRKIVVFLDEKLVQVDNLIANVQAQIEKLKSYKQSLIAEVVTKGLDPTVPMKDSGVEWIGEIPAHWEIKRGKALFKETEAKSSDGSEELLTVSQYTGITPRSQKNVTMFEALSLEGYKICEIGDIAANTMWLWAGAIGVSEYRGVISPSYNVYRQRGNHFVPRYLDHLLRAPMLVQEYASLSTGIRASRLRLYPKDFFNIMFPVPPIEEQQAILDALSSKFSAVDRLIAIKQAKIEKLEQYKRSLIYEYVTGKKEVV